MEHVEKGDDMKVFKICLMALLAASLVAVFACDDPKINNDGEKSTDDGGVETGFQPILTECDSNKLCSALGNPVDCVATFDYEGTLQSGYPGIANAAKGGERG